MSLKRVPINNHYINLSKHKLSISRYSCLMLRARPNYYKNHLVEFCSVLPSKPRSVVKISFHFLFSLDENTSQKYKKKHILCCPMEPLPLLNRNYLNCCPRSKSKNKHFTFGGQPDGKKLYWEHVVGHCLSHGECERGGERG